MLGLRPEELVSHLSVADLQRGGDPHRPEAGEGTAHEGISMLAWHKGVGQNDVPEGGREGLVRRCDVLGGGKVTQAPEEPRELLPPGTMRLKGCRNQGAVLVPSWCKPTLR